MHSRAVEFLILSGESREGGRHESYWESLGVQEKGTPGPGLPGKTRAIRGREVLLCSLAPVLEQQWGRAGFEERNRKVAFQCCLAFTGCRDRGLFHC